MDSEPSFAVILAWAFGFGLYTVVAYEHRHWPVVVLLALIVIGAAGLISGILIMRRRPRLAVWLISLWLLFSLALATFTAAGVIWAGVSIHRKLHSLPQSQRDPLAEVIGVVLNGLIGWLILTRLSKKTSWLWPTAPTRFAFKHAFGDGIHDGGTREYDALYEDHVRGPGPFKGWGMGKRLRRAKILG